MDFHAAQSADQPIGGLSVHMFVRPTERADGPDVLAVLATWALAVPNMVEIDVAREWKASSRYLCRSNLTNRHGIRAMPVTRRYSALLFAG